jgi:ferredoxin
MSSETQNEKVGAALVVGGGIGGMQAALDLAAGGIKVYLAEKKAAIGGVMSQLDKTFPTNDCAMCTQAPRLVEIGRHKDINIIPLSDIEAINGHPGNFNVILKERPRYVDAEKCTGCGECCRLEVVNPREHDGLLWVDRITIDEGKCIQCGDCVRACIEENKEKTAMTSIARDRRDLILVLPQEPSSKEALMHRIARMDGSERARYWNEQLRKCLKCGGCRDVCPVCICNDCELKDPTWISPGRSPSELFFYHLIRAYHLADLCTGCGACEATCPVGIPLLTLMHLVRLDKEKIFDYVPGIDIERQRRLIERTDEYPVSKREARA